MAEGSLVNLGDISKPATVLIERVSDAVGGIAKPWQMKRVAKAEAEVEKIKALAAIELTEIQERSLTRLIIDAENKQRNVEAVTAKSIPYLKADADPASIDRDWLVSMFDKAQSVSNEDMQELWGRILGEEANKPGSFSRTTLEIVNSLDSRDAQSFQRICSAAWNWGSPRLFISDPNDTKIPGLDFDDINSLEALGLISTGLGYSITGINQKSGYIGYCGIRIHLEFANDSQNTVSTGTTLFTRSGVQLALIVTPEPIRAAFDATIKMLIDQGCWVSIDRLSPNINWLKETNN